MDIGGFRMSEYTIGFIACGNLVALALAATLYMCGGRKDKWIRRYLGSFMIALAINLTAVFFEKWSYWLLLLYPMLILQFSMGYGVSGVMPKWVKRLLISLLSVVTGFFLCCILGGGIWLLIIHALVAVGTVVFAFKNPIYASAEEPLVCILNNLLLIFYPFIIK